MSEPKSRANRIADLPGQLSPTEAAWDRLMRESMRDLGISAGGDTVKPFNFVDDMT